MDKISKLKRLRIAYEIAEEYDTVPGVDRYDEVREWGIAFDSDILAEFEGSSPYDLVQKVFSIINELEA